MPQYIRHELYTFILSSCTYVAVDFEIIYYLFAHLDEVRCLCSESSQSAWSSP